MVRRDAAGEWLSLMDYAMKKGVSLSTLRRHIKSGKVTFKVEGGRYLLFDNELMHSDDRISSYEERDARTSRISDDTQALLAQLHEAQQEIAELKTLIALYEETPPQKRLNT